VARAEQELDRREVGEVEPRAVVGEVGEADADRLELVAPARARAGSSMPPP